MKNLLSNSGVIGVTAPAGALTPELFAGGITALESLGLRVKVAPHAAGHDIGGYLSGTAAERAADLEALWLDPEVELILCARGGFGCMQLPELLDWEKLRSRPMRVVGYSDITALHFAMLRYQAGIPIVGPMFSRFAADPSTAAAELAAALHPSAANSIDCAVWRAGDVTGLPLPGNLTVAASLAGTGLLPDASGRIIILEDLNEAAHRIARGLSQLRLAGFFDRAAAVVFGEFSDCPGAEAVLRRFANEYQKCPVFANFPYGHVGRLAAIDCTRKVTIDRTGKFTVQAAD